MDLRGFPVDAVISHFGGVRAINKLNSILENNPFFRKILTGEQVRELYARGVRNLIGANLTGAKINQDTKFPPSFDLQSSGVVRGG